MYKLDLEKAEEEKIKLLKKKKKKKQQLESDMEQRLVPIGKKALSPCLLNLHAEYIM